MKHVLKMMVMVAGVAAAAPAWAQPSTIAYSFSSASPSGLPADVRPSPVRAPGADALRWLGGLGPTQAEPNPERSRTERR